MILRWVRSRDPALWVVVITMTVVHCARPTVSYRALALDASPFTIGLLIATYSALPFLGAIPIGRAIDGHGERRFLLGGTALVIASLGIMVVGGLPGLFVGQALFGLGHIGVGVSAHSRAAFGGVGGRDSRFAQLSVATSLGQLFGPGIAGAILGTEPLERTGLVFGVTAGIALVGLLISFRVTSRAGQGVGPRTPLTAAAIGGAVRRPGMPAALFAGIGVLSAIDLITVFLPLLGEARGVPASVVGVLLSIRAGAGLASRLALGPMVHRLGRRRLLVGSLATAGAAMGGVVLSDRPVVWGVLLAVVGFGLGVGTPMTASWVAGRSPEGMEGTTMSIRLMTNRLSQLVIPTAVGALAAASGVGAIFVVGAAGLLACSVGVVRSDIDR